MTLAPEAHGAPSHLTSIGTVAAALLAAAAAAVVGLSIAGGISRDAVGIGLFSGGIVGSAVGMGFFWRLLVPRGGSYSVPFSILAGLLAAIAAHIIAWLGFLVAVSIASAQSLPDLAEAFGFSISMLATSVILAGMVTIPAGIAVAVVVTVWCRWRRSRTA
jgi:hypothetical protein